ncbi:MAG: tetratricopeptide repeat protein, partial [Bacteroidota bacterium]|nr:tetratricopeptide repeat protein [Bacteroidota bacterium]
MIKQHLYKHFLLLLLVILFPAALFSQIDIDSIKLALREAGNEKKAPILIKLSNEYKIVSQKLSLKYGHEALAYSLKFKNDPNTALAYKTIGIQHYYYRQIDSAIHYNLLALEKYKQIEDLSGVGKTLNNLGVFYSNIGLYKKSIEYHLQSLEIKENLNDTTGIAYSYNNIGTLYYQFKNFDSALQYYSKALKMSVDISDETGKQSALSNIGLIYSDQHKYKEALIVLNEALDINHRL